MDRVLQDPRLHPKVREAGVALQNMAKNKGITILYYCSYRSNEQQAKEYAKGRTAPGPIVTNAKPGQSMHNYGLALDFVPLVSGKAAWDRNDLYQTVGALAIQAGFSWGGAWKRFIDKPHLEKNMGFSLANLQSGKRPPDTPKGV